MKRLIAFPITAVALLALASCGSDAKTSSTSPATAAPTTTVASPSTAAVTSDAPTTTATPVESTDASTAETTAPSTASAADEVDVQLVDSAFGKILATADGKTLYLFTKDSGSTSACAGGCAAAWPPLAGTPKLGDGLDAEDFSTITRDDGTAQVTFYGHPLYFFANDTKAGDVTGQASGGVWYVVDGEGNAVTAAAAPATDGY